MSKTPPSWTRTSFETKKVGKFFCVINEMQRLQDSWASSPSKTVIPSEGLIAR